MPQMADIFIGSARPFAFKEMVCKGTGDCVCITGRISKERKKKKKRKAKGESGKRRNHFLWEEKPGGLTEVINPHVLCVLARHVVFPFELHVLKAVADKEE